MKCAGCLLASFSDIPARFLHISVTPAISCTIFRTTIDKKIRLCWKYHSSGLGTTIFPSLPYSDLFSWIRSLPSRQTSYHVSTSQAVLMWQGIHKHHRMKPYFPASLGKPNHGTKLWLLRDEAAMILATPM